MAFIIPADSTKPTVDVEPHNGTDFKLKQLYSLLDCTCIELVRLPSGRLMICDGEGKLVANPVRNVRATRLAHFVSPRAFIAQMARLREAGVEVILGAPITDNEIDYIAGDVLICEDGELR